METVLYAAILMYSAVVLGMQIEENVNINNGTWLKAFSDCNKTRSHLPAYKVASDHKDIGVWMEKRMINTLWLSLNKTRFPTWMWLDNGPVDHEFSKQNWRDFMNCGVLHLRDKAIEVDRCSKHDLGYVCTSATVTSCMDGSFHQSDCTSFNNGVYVYGCGAENWYDARHRCKKDGMDLAIMKSEPLMRHLHQVWYKVIRKKCTKLWMGLRRNDWQYQGKTVKGKFSSQSFWALGEPSERGSCAVISKRAGSNVYKWYAEDCNNVHSFFCDHSEKHQETTSAIEVTGEFSRVNFNTQTVTKSMFGEKGTRVPPEGRKANATVIVLPIVAVLFIVGGFAFVLWRRRRHSKKKVLRNHEMGLLSEQFQMPESEISLTAPNLMFDGCSASDVMRIDAYMKPELYKIPGGAKLLTPIVTVGHGFGSKTKFGQVMWLTIPHRLSAPNMEEHITVYIRRPAGGKWRMLKHGTVEEERAVIQKDFIAVPFHRPISVMCTCRREVISSMNLAAVLFSEYYEEKTFQGMTLRLFFIDSMYSIKDCIKTLEKNHDDYELIHVKASAIREISDREKVKPELEVHGDWEFISPVNGETKYQELQALKPTNTSPVGVEVANWIIKHQMAVRDDKTDSLKIRLTVHLLDRNVTMCDHQQVFDSLEYEDGCQDEDACEKQH